MLVRVYVRVCVSASVLRVYVRTHVPCVCACVCVSVTGSIETLISLLGSSDTEVQGYAGFALNYLAKRSPDIGAMIWDAGGLPAFMQLLASSGVYAQQAAANALVHCVQIDEDHSDLTRQKQVVQQKGALHNMARMLASSNPGVQSAGARLLTVLARDCEPNQQAVIAAGFVGRLSQLVHTTNDGEAEQWAIEALFAVLGGFRQELVADVVMMIASDNAELQQAGATMVMVIASADSLQGYREALVDTDVMVLLVRLLTSDDPVTVTAARRAVSALGYHMA